MFAFSSEAMTLQLKTMKTVALEKATPANCGAKAAACAELAKVAAGARFKTPAGVCLPFGTMEAAIKVCATLLSSLNRGGVLQQETQQDRPAWYDVDKYGA